MWVLEGKHYVLIKFFILSTYASLEYSSNYTCVCIMNECSSYFYVL